MALHVNRPPAVRSLAELTQMEKDRLNLVLRESDLKIRGNREVPRDALEAILQANARAIHKLALDRVFYSEEAAQQVEIDVQVTPRIITQKSETFSTVIKKTLVQAVFGTLGWTLAESNPVLGFGVTAIGSVVNSDACKEKLGDRYNKGRSGQ